MRRHNRQRLSDRRLIGRGQVAIDFARKRVGIRRDTTIPRQPHGVRPTALSLVTRHVSRPFSMVAFGHAREVDSLRRRSHRHSCAPRIDRRREGSLRPPVVARARYAEQIQAIDTAGVPPTSHVLSRIPADRPDESRPSLTNAEALSNAPDPSPQAGLFRVPRCSDRL